jgi:diadenylate cyclase
MELVHHLVSIAAAIFGRLTPMVLVDIFLTAFLIYQFFSMIRGRRAAHAFAGLSVLGLLYFSSVYLNLELLRKLLTTLAPYSVFGLMVLFQSEIRRLLAKLGRHNGWVGFAGRIKRREFVEEILMATEILSQTKTGALIVIERDMGLRTFVESGVPMDAVVSRDLLLAIFQNKGPLHDGAVMIQNERLAAAACFLPLTTNPVMSKAGTRHRSAIGVTEDSDCITVVVSEETGRISAAAFGHLLTGLSVKELSDLIGKHLDGRTTEETFLGETEAPFKAAKPAVDRVKTVNS